MCRPKGYDFWPFLVWKRVYTLVAHFDLESGVVFEETTEMYESSCRFSSK